jgi:hypothetical protein
MREVTINIKSYASLTRHGSEQSQHGISIRPDDTQVFFSQPILISNNLIKSVAKGTKGADWIESPLPDAIFLSPVSPNWTFTYS